MAREIYFLYLDGVQRGPYTVFQISHMVNTGIVQADSLFWCEGLEQWQPVSQLIKPREEVKRRRLLVWCWVFGLALFLLGALWVVMPSLRQGWMEQHQVDRTSLAAYWRARGVLRERLGSLSSLEFEGFESASFRAVDAQTFDVDLLVKRGRSASQVFAQKWRVGVTFDQRLKMWVPTGKDPELLP